VLSATEPETTNLTNYTDLRRNKRQRPTTPLNPTKRCPARQYQSAWQSTCFKL